MHMANELLNPTVSLATSAIAAGGIALAVRRVRQTADRDVPLMGVLGAFVFAAQMVNVQVLPGASGHLVGAVLMMLLIGPARALLVMTAILTVQCLVFQDGGILALGANIIDMGIVPIATGSLVYRLLCGRPRLASFLAAQLGVLAGAFTLPFFVALSGRSAIAFSTFLVVIVGIHLPISLLEGAVTSGTVSLLARLGFAKKRKEAPRAMLATILAAAVVTATVLALIASNLPDGLEYALANWNVLTAAPRIVSPALFAGYGNGIAKAAAGLAGILLTTLAVVLLSGRSKPEEEAM